MHKILGSIVLCVLVLPLGFAQTKTDKNATKKIPVTSSTINNNGNVATASSEEKLAVIRVKISTDLGDIVVQLSNKTPKHRDNFVRLVNEHFYDSLLFHRIIKNFMIQGGSPASKNAAPGKFVGAGDVSYTIPAEFDSSLYHKRGSLAAARNDNPDKASSGCQFYIVQGKIMSNSELDIIEKENGVYFSSAKRMTYKMIGGTPVLDMKYTVFGEVESGMDVVDKIAATQTDGNSRPLSDIKMKMEVMKEEIK
jgi:cyclophilin family peptidyl-prolyl cis-trans isomerase